MPDIDMPPLLTIKQGAPFLTDGGFPITTRYLSKLCCPGSGEGPVPATSFGGKVLFTPQELLRWARARCKPPLTGEPEPTSHAA
jgi:hypothetical protein